MNTMKQMRNCMYALGILLFAGFLSVNAQTTNKGYRDQVRLTIGVASNHAIDAEISYHHMFLPYVGIGGGIGLMGQYDYNKTPFGEIASSNSTRAFWGLDKDQRKIVRPYLRPSLILRTPTLIKMGKERDFRLRLEIEPGVQLTVPYTRTRINYVWYPQQGGSYPAIGDDYDDIPLQTENYSSRRGTWCFWNLKNSITVSNDHVSFSLGYSISNFDIYSIRRNIVVEGVSFHQFYPKKEYTHCVFAGIGYAF